MRMTRREVLVAGAAAALLPRGAWGQASALSAETRSALDTSPLVYVSALKRDGAESHCHAEVWFVRDGESALVVTSAQAWRAQAIGKGLSRARLWVGDFGVWSGKSDYRRYAAGLAFDAQASLEKAPVAHDHALSLFGSKYTREWGSWGPRFKNGLADGSRALIRYRAIAG